MSKRGAQLQALANMLVAEAKPRFAVFLKYAKVELIPPSPGDIPQIGAAIAKIISGARSGAWKQTPVKEAWLNTLITIEVICWFYVGECIGKHHIIGYNV